MSVSELVPSRYYALVGAIAVTLIALAAALLDPRWLLLAGAAGVVSAVGLHDLLQKHHAILRNYPILAHFRFFFETIRPEIRQYLLEGDNEAVPFSRAQRSLVYQRAKNVEDRQPFGTGKDVYLGGYEWINHSLRPVHIADTNFRVMVGGKECKQPYSCSVFNISAMSFGALSANAVRALNKGAKLGGFAHDTGEAATAPITAKVAATSSGKWARDTSAAVIKTAPSTPRSSPSRRAPPRSRWSRSRSRRAPSPATAACCRAPR